MLELAALIIGTVATSLIALIVYVKDRRSITNRLFIALAVGLVGWSITTYFSLHVAVASDTLDWIRRIMFFVIVQNTSFFLLVHVFPDRESDLFHKKRYIFAVLYAALTAGVALSPYLFVGFKDGSPQPGPGMPLFMIHALVFAVGGLVGLVLRYRKARGIRKVQLRYFLAASIVLFTLVPLVNFILPLAFNNSSLVVTSPLYTLAFAAIIAYAIVAKRLFDIRLAVARAVVYILSLGFIVLAYGAFVFALSSTLINQQSIRAQRIELIAFALVTALLFPSVRRFFTKVTNRVLYQDAYDAEQLFNALNRVLASNIELDKLLIDSLAVLNNALKTDYSAIAVNIPGSEQMRLFGRLNKTFDERIVEIISEKRTSDDLSPVVVVDLLPEDGNHELIQMLRKSQIDVVAILGYRANAQHKIIGYILLGPKKSGHPYDPHDADVLEAIANEMVVAIQNSLRFEEIKNFNVTLQEEVDSATAKLRRTNRRLEELDNIKDDFISMASHQLRTPLTSVKGYLSMMIDGDAGKVNPTQDKMLHQAFGSAQRMVFLITDLLNVSRLKTGKFVIDAKPTNLADLIEEEVEQLGETAKAKGLKLQYHKPADFPELMLDDVKIRQVAMNFIDNAIYYTPQGGHINIQLIDKPKTIEMRVSDDGIGVPRSEQHHLFTKFYRAENARKARPDGTGLGLFMAQKVILAQGGSVIFQSKEGEGSTFGFTFSKDKLQPPVVEQSLAAVPAKP